MNAYDVDQKTLRVNSVSFAATARRSITATSDFIFLKLSAGIADLISDYRRMDPGPGFGPQWFGAGVVTKIIKQSRRYR